jgi:hypothetical protein
MMTDIIVRDSPLEGRKHVIVTRDVVEKAERPEVTTTQKSA